MTNNYSKHKPELPFISICTPTFNRRPFISLLIKCIQHQTYPKEKMEWVIIDDGSDCIEDLIKDIDWIQVSYFHYKEQMLLGRKRNIMHSKCKGDILVYMDDDDYYPCERVSHAVDMLLHNPSYSIAGSSEMHLYYHDLNQMYQCGPYADYHATAATFAFRKELLEDASYNDENALAEERIFLKKYSIPLLQLDASKTIMVIAHSHNSFDKKKMLETPVECRISPSRFTVQDFIKDPVLQKMYTKDIHELIQNYAPGTLDHKPEIVKQVKQMQENREQRIALHKKQIQQQQQQQQQQEKGTNFTTMDEMRQYYEKVLADKDKLISQKSCLIHELLKKLKDLTA